MVEEMYDWLASDLFLPHCKQLFWHIEKTRRDANAQNKPFAPVTKIKLVPPVIRKESALPKLYDCDLDGTRAYPYAQFIYDIKHFNVNHERGIFDDNRLSEWTIMEKIWQCHLRMVLMTTPGRSKYSSRESLMMGLCEESEAEQMKRKQAARSEAKSEDENRRLQSASEAGQRAAGADKT